MDLNHRPPGPEESGVKNLSAASGVACRTLRPFTLALNWTEDGLMFNWRLSCVQIEGLQPSELVSSTFPLPDDSRGGLKKRPAFDCARDFQAATAI